MNGRLDLSQAEAVLTHQGQVRTEPQVAQRQLRGELAQQVHRLRTELVRLLAHLEAGIDFEEDITFVRREEMMALSRDTGSRSADVGTAETDGSCARESAW